MYPISGSLIETRWALPNYERVLSTVCYVLRSCSYLDRNFKVENFLLKQNNNREVWKFKNLNFRNLKYFFLRLWTPKFGGRKFLTHDFASIISVNFKAGYRNPKWRNYKISKPWMKQFLKSINRVSITRVLNKKGNPGMIRPKIKRVLFPNGFDLWVDQSVWF